MIRAVLLILFVSLVSAFSYAGRWEEDILGNGFEKRTVTLPDDYSGKVRSTIIRKMSKEDRHKAIVYIHGYNDYFFQQEMADRFVDSCYNFYAIDLRKYGRSFIEGQRRFEVRNMAEYFPEIDSVMTQAVNDGNTSIIMKGHSTGGLLSSYYLAKNKTGKFPIKGVILNSPFLDMNLSGFFESVLVPMVSSVAKLFKNISIPQGDSNAYAQSLLKKYHGEWDYNTDWKLEVSPAVTSGWIRAIHTSQKFLQKGVNLNIPTLLLHSDKSIYGNEWTPEFNKGDAVLDINDISKYGKRLSGKLTEMKVYNGLHDLYLSDKKVREALYLKTFEWLKREGL